MILMWENPLLGPLEGVGPENLDFTPRYHFRTKKISIFRAHPFQQPLQSRIKIINLTPYTLHNKYTYS
jgi:hypothetical protein